MKVDNSDFVRKMLMMLNPEIGETEALRLLHEFFELTQTQKESEWAAVSKELDGQVELELKLRELLPRLQEMLTPNPGKHPLAGFASGPVGKEAGTNREPRLVAKEVVNAVHARVVKECVINGRTSFSLSDRVHVKVAGKYGRVQYTGSGCPPHFDRQPDGAAFEVFAGYDNDGLDLIAGAAAIALEYGGHQVTVNKEAGYVERQRSHPLAGFAGGPDRSGPNVPTVVCGPGH